LGLEPKFLNATLPVFDSSPRSFDRPIGEILRDAGWERVGAGGLVITCQSSSSPVSIPASVINRISSLRGRQEVVLALTASGWTVADDGSVTQADPAQRAYLAPHIVNALKRDHPEVLQAIIDSGGHLAGPSYWNPMRVASPHLPITPDAIIRASVEAALAGAAVVHLHTRDTTDAIKLEFPGEEYPIWLSKQRNYIDVE